MPPKPRLERRNSTRVTVSAEVKLTGASLSTVRNRMSDLSLTGAFIDTNLTLAPGTTIDMEFQIQGVTFKLKAEVVNLMPGFGVGVRFLNLSPEQKRLLEKLLLPR